MALHNGDRHAVARRQQSAALHDLGGAKDIGLFDRENVVHDIQYKLEGRPNRFSSVDRSVPMDHLLQNLGISHKPLSRCNLALREKLRLGLVRGEAHQLGRSECWSRQRSSLVGKEDPQTLTPSWSIPTQQMSLSFARSSQREDAVGHPRRRGRNALRGHPETFTTSCTSSKTIVFDAGACLYGFRLPPPRMPGFRPTTRAFDDVPRQSSYIDFSGEDSSGWRQTGRLGGLSRSGPRAVQKRYSVLDLE